MTIADDIRILLDALAEKPTEGPWTAYVGGHHARAAVEAPNGHVCGLSMRRANTYAKTRERTVEQMQADAKYIAACSPERIGRLLAYLERNK